MITLLLVSIILLSMPNWKAGGGEFSKDKTLILKAFLPFLILIHHLWMFDDFNQVGIYVVAMFFFISGYGLQYKREVDSISIKAFFHSIRKLLIPLIIPSICYVLLLILYKEIGMEDLYTELAGYKIILPYTWFVVSLIILYCFFYSLSIFQKNNKVFLISMMVAVLVVIAAFWKVGLMTTYYQTSLAFIAGCVYKSFEDHKYISMSINMKRIILGLVLTVVTIVSIQDIPISNLIKFMLCSVAWVVCIAVLMSGFHCRLTETIRFLSSISYEMYICQGITFIFVNRFNDDSFLLIILKCFCANLIISIIMHTITQKMIILYDTVKTRTSRLSGS